jgi:hypothetical protein
MDFHRRSEPASSPENALDWRKVMGIDRIGKGAPPAPSTVSPPERGAVGEASKAFEVRPAHISTSAAVTPSAPVGATPLDRLRAGEIDLDRYLDLKVQEATAHLKGLRAHEMDGLRAKLREQLSGDPGLATLVEQATGQRPAAKE